LLFQPICRLWARPPEGEQMTQMLYSFSLLVTVVRELVKEDVEIINWNSICNMWQQTCTGGLLGFKYTLRAKRHRWLQSTKRI
jgi:hypothetical protein